MQNTPAIFVDTETVYHADTCDALSDAVRLGKIETCIWARGTYPGKRLPENILKEICSIGVWDAKYDQNWGLAWHRNEGLEITYLERGKLGFSVDDWEGNLLPGHLTITRPWQEHRVGLPKVGSSRLHWLIFDVGIRQPHAKWIWPDWIILSPTDLEKLTAGLRGNEQPVWSAGQEMGECFRKIFTTLRDGDVLTLESKLKVQINSLLLAVLELLNASKTPLNPALSSANRTVEYFIEQLPKHVEFNWDLKSMAKQCGMARSQFSLHCHRLTNATPMKFLTQSRINAAKKILQENPELNISEIASRCGFQTSQYFATQFRKQTQYSPAEYRKRMTEDAAPILELV